MNKILKVILLGIIISTQLIGVSFAASGKYNKSMNEVITDIRTNIDPASTIATTGGGDSIKMFIFDLIDDIIIPLAISAGVVVGIVGAYKLLFSSDEKQVSAGLKMVVFGIIGIIVMVSAKYIGSVLFEDIFISGDVEGISGIELSKSIYDKIAYPFIKIALYLALAVIFVILVGKSISLITKSDGTSHKTALGMIGRCAVSILIIIGAKNIIEAIYGKQSEVFDDANNNLGNIGSGILADKNIPIVYNVITRALSIIGLLILILLLVQGFTILLKPSKAENFLKLGKTILYSLIGLFVIGIGYLIANSFILN